MLYILVLSIYTYNENYKETFLTVLYINDKEISFMIDQISELKLRDISDIAHELLAKHGLNDWQFCFDHAKSRAGLCNYSKKIISISRSYANEVKISDVKNTILHEIAHALVGHSHGHDAAWKVKALEIGCDAKRCHNVKFSLPRWIIECPNGCFSISRFRKNKNLICKNCKIPVVYKKNNV